MKLLHVIAGMNPKLGGVGEALRTMVGTLDSMGVHNEIVCLDGKDEAFIKEEKAIIHALGPGKGPWCYSDKLNDWLDENILRFDAIINHGLWLYTGYATRNAVKHIKAKFKSANEPGYKVPLLYIMPHGMLDPYFQKARGRKVKAIRNWFFWKLIEHKLISTADGLFFTSLTEQALAKVSFKPYRPKKEVVIGLGTEQPPYYMADMQQAFAKNQLNCSPYFLFLSRINEKKGIDILIRAYQKVLKENDFLPKLVIAGPGLETALGQQLQQWVEKNNLSSNIRFTGMLTGLAKWGAFYGCEAFILPSHQENFGIAVVEALACGKAVLISDKINIWQEIKASACGLVEADTEEGVVVLLQRWLSMTCNEKVEMGAYARQLYEKSYATEPAAARLLNAISLTS